MKDDTYLITISRTSTVTTKKSPGYQVVDKRPLTQKEFDDANSAWRTGAETGKSMKEVYGYPPAREIEEIIETKIFEQRVTGLDLAKVIKAANNL